MKLNERHLIQLAAVVDAGGVSEGASALGQTQPAVSRSLALLEARVGAPLFHRGRRPLQPTPLGLQLAAHGRAMLAASKAASETVQGFQRGSRGMIRIGGVPFFMDAMISRMIADFHGREPEVAIRQTYGYLAEIVTALETDQIDLGVVPVGELEPPPGFQLVELLPGRNLIACRTGHPLTRKAAPLLADVVAYPWVAPLPGSPLASDMQAILLAIGIPEVTTCYSGGSLMSTVHFLAETDALAILPQSVVFALRRERRIEALPLTIPQPNRRLCILRRAGGANPVVDRFTQHLVAAFGDLRHLIRRHDETAGRGP